MGDIKKAIDETLIELLADSQENYSYDSPKETLLAKLSYNDGLIDFYYRLFVNLKNNEVEI